MVFNVLLTQKLNKNEKENNKMVKITKIIEKIYLSNSSFFPR